MEYPLNRRMADDSYRARLRRWVLIPPSTALAQGALYEQTPTLLTSSDLLLWSGMVGRNFGLCDGYAARDRIRLHGAFGGRVRVAALDQKRRQRIKHR